MPPPHSYVPLMASSAAPLSADDLLRARIPDKRTELVQGRLIVREPAGSLHGLVAMSLGAELVAHVKRTWAGGVFAAETGFKLASNPDTVRAPDVAFIAKDRLPSRDTKGYPALSPDDRAGEVLAKVGDWLSAGCRLVWVVDPERRVARVYRHDGTETIVDETGALDGEEVLPGFSCALATIL